MAISPQNLRGVKKTTTSRDPTGWERRDACATWNRGACVFPPYNMRACARRFPRWLASSPTVWPGAARRAAHTPACTLARSFVLSGDQAQRRASGASHFRWITSSPRSRLTGQLSFLHARSRSSILLLPTPQVQRYAEELLCRYIRQRSCSCCRWRRRRRVVRRRRRCRGGGARVRVRARARVRVRVRGRGRGRGKGRVGAGAGEREGE